MEGAGDSLVTLNAPARVRALDVGAEVGALRATTTDRVAALLGDPPLVVLTSSCSSALEAAAGLLAIEPGDEVVVPAFTFPTTVIPFLERGAVLRFADVDLRSANVDPVSVGTKIGPRTRAVVVTHYAGVAADLGDVGASLPAQGVDLVEDAAHGIGASVDGRPLGRLGRFGALSFHRTKNLSALEGGALVVNHHDDVDAALVAVDKGNDRVAFDRGEVPSYQWSGPGSERRMPDPAVQYLDAELEAFDEGQSRRRLVVDRYRAELADWAERTGVLLPEVPANVGSPAHLFHLVLPGGREDLVAHAAAVDVQLARHYGSLPDSRYGRTVARPEDRCPNAAALADRLVRLPLHHALDDVAVDRVVAAVTSWHPPR